MDSQIRNNIDESIPIDYAAVEEPNHGRFPRHQVDVTETNYREVNVDQLSESDFEGMKDSGLAYSDHDYIGANPNAKVAPETSQFPVMGGVTDQYLNGETNDPCAERTDNRMPGMSISGSVVKKPQHPSALRTVKSDDYGTSAAHHTYPQPKPYKDVTQPKKSGRPSKNETRELAGERLMARAMVKAGMQGHHLTMQPQQLIHVQGMHPIQDHSVNFRGAAPIVTAARGQKITPRGRPTIGLRRDIPDEGTSGYTMMSTQQGIPPSKPIPTKKTAHFGSAQAAEDAHSREMMQAAQNALAPSNAMISGMSVQPPLPSHSSLPHLHPHPSHHDSIVLPPHNRLRTSSHRYDDGDLPRTPGKVHAYTPISSPHSAVHDRPVSESHEMNILIQEPIRTNSDGLPVTPGGGRKTPLTSRTPRSRMSISESTGSQTASPQRQIVLSPSRSHVMIQSRPIPSSPQQQRQMPIGGHLKPMGPSTMASAQMQMSSNAPLPSLHTQSQSMVVQRQSGESPSKRGYYDFQGGEAAPLITGSGSMTYNPRRKKERETGEAVDAVVNRNVKAILQSDKTPRLSTTRSDISLSPTNDMSDEEIIDRGGQIQETAYESKRTASKKKEHKVLASEESNSDEGESEKWEISCICGQKEDDGEKMVRCDQCILRWEHVDCIFPKTKKAPSGSYFCHVCKPRPTDLTREQARAYQDRVKTEKDEAMNQELKRKLAERARRKEENSRKLSSVVRSTPKASVIKSEKSGNSSYREILKNDYSTTARRLILVSRLPIIHSSGIDIVNKLRNNPIIRSLYVETKVYGIVVTEEVCEGAYIAELLGYISLEKECPNRDVVPGSLNDHTFLFEMDQDKIIIDARKCGNMTTKYLRRSCKPNAELEAIMCGSEMHIMIKATQRLELHDEVSIKLEDGWMKRPRPAQGCGCDKMKEKDKCELERFFMTQNISSSSRKSLPVNGTTPMSGRSPIRRALTEKKKVASAKKVITKKGKRKGTIKLPRRNMKGGSSRGRETADEIDDDEEEGESDMEYEESEEEKEKEKRGRPRGRGRRNTEESSDRTMKERGKREKKKGLNEDESLTLNTSSRSTRLRSDSEMKKETPLMINEDSNEKRKSKRISESEIGESKKGGKKSLIEKGEDEVKEEWPSTNTAKKTRKSWPVMDYTLPSERGKDREKRKMEAEIERIERQNKKSGSKPRGRPPASSYASNKEEKKGKERDVKIPSGRRKRKVESEDEDDDTGRISAVISTPIPSSRKRLSAAEGRKKEEEASSPIPSLSTSSLVSLTHSIVSPMTDDTTHIPSHPASGKKKLLLRYQEAEKEKEKAAAMERSTRGEVPSSTWTPTRWTRVNKEEKGDKGKMESFNRRELKEKGEGNRQDMRRHAIYLRDTLTPSTFSIGSMSGTGVRVETPSSHSSLMSPSIPSSSIAPPSSTRVPDVSTPMEKEKTVKKSAVSYEEYKKRKKEGEIISGEDKKDGNEKKEEVAKKSFMPRVDSSVYALPSLPNVTLPGLDEHVGLDELKRRVYDESPRRGGTSSSIGTIGKSEPTPKRQSINDRLKNEFSLPMLSTPPPPPLPSSSTTLLSTSTPLSTISMPSLPNEDLLTPIGGRIHKNRLSDTKAPNVGPPGVMSECPRPISLDSSISSSISVRPSTTSSSFFYCSSK